MSNLASEVQVLEEQPSVRRIAAESILRAAGEGVTEMGPIGEATGPYASASEWQREYGGYTASSLDSVAAVTGFFDNGGTQLYWSRIVHTTVVGDPTTKTSAKGTLNLLTAAGAPTSGFVQSAAQPFDLEPGDDLDVKIDGGGAQTFTITGTAAARVTANAEPFTLANGQTFVISIDGGANITKTFLTGEFSNIAAATAEEVVSALNAFFASQGAGAVASGTTTVTVTSNRRGSGSGVNISATSTSVGASPLLQFTTGNIAGTGNVSNVNAVTAAEWVTIMAGLTGAVASVVSSALKITSSTTGTGSSVQVDASSTADDEMGFNNAVNSGSSGAATATLQLDGKWDGDYAAQLRAIVSDATDGDASHFNLAFEFKGVVVERFSNLSMLDADTTYAETIVNDENGGSIYIAVVDLDAGGAGASAAVQRPANGTSAFLAGGNAGLSGLVDTDYTGGETVNGSTGLRTFDDKDIDVIFTPGRATSAVHNATITYCEITRAGLVFAILDPPANQTAAQMVTYVTTTASLFGLTEHAAIYWPRVKVANPSTALFGADPTVVVPPSGHLAGIYARTDARKVGGAFEQPAGVELGVPRNVLGLEMEEVRKKAKRELVFPKNINPISQEDGTPIFVDGARVLKLTGSWPSVGQRRGVIFVEKRLIPGLAFMRHRNIKPRLYKEGERTVKLFLLELTRNEAFKSTDPSKAFFVDFGPGLNPPSVQAQRKVVARIGLATSEPAEFIILLVGPDTRALDEELAALAA
jgi:hypothetical protein